MVPEAVFSSWTDLHRSHLASHLNFEQYHNLWKVAHQENHHSYGSSNLFNYKKPNNTIPITNT